MINHPEINYDVLSSRFDRFCNFIEVRDLKRFTSFSESSFVDDREMYKYTLYDEARNKIYGSNLLTIKNVGTGRIIEAIESAINVKINNLVDWRKKSLFNEMENPAAFEKVAFDFYSSKIDDRFSFDAFIGLKIPYQIIAYLFFIKDRDKFLPISQHAFNHIFRYLSIDFKTNNCSWDNYSQYCDIITQVKDFLIDRGITATLLDAHSYLWILGEASQFLSTEQWCEIVNDSTITNQDDYNIIEQIYHGKRDAVEIAEILHYEGHQAINNILFTYASRIAKQGDKYNFSYDLRMSRKKNVKLIDLFILFDNKKTSGKWLFRLQPELQRALDIINNDYSNTFLFVWNPQKWEWSDFSESIISLKEKGFYQDDWTVAAHKMIRKGDRFFVIRLGDSPKGIFASGYVYSQPFTGTIEHKGTKHSVAKYVTLQFDDIRNPQDGNILSLSTLKDEVSNSFKWQSQSSGISIPRNVAMQLETLWERNEISEMQYGKDVFPEGRNINQTSIRKERNRNAIRKCKETKGCSCYVCDMNFANIYGEIGKGFIHVHHITPISKSTGVHNVSLDELVPVCPNCHAMLHRKDPPYTIEELRKIIRKKERTNR